MNSNLPGETFAPVAPTARERRARLLLAAGTFLLLAAIALALGGPTRITYRLDPGELVVIARWGAIVESRTLELADLVGARPAVLGSGVRLFGSNAPGFCVGTFRYERLGTVWQATSCGRQVVVLESRVQGLVVIEPQAIDSFLDSLYARTPSVHYPPPAPPDPLWLAFQGLIWLLPVLIGGTFILVGRGLRYRVHDGYLIVSTALGSRRYPLRGARARRLSSRHRLQGLGLGARLPGYSGGRFLIAGRYALTAATRLDEGVLVERGDYRLFVTPAESQGFLRALAENQAQVVE